jgi:hypothetical protein
LQYSLPLSRRKNEYGTFNKGHHFIACTDEVRNRIWNSKYDIRGSLYLLWVEKEKAIQRSAEEQMEYGFRLRSDGFFKPDIGKTPSGNWVTVLIRKFIKMSSYFSVDYRKKEMTVYK